METESKYKCGRAEEVVEYKTVITRIVDQSRDLGYLRAVYTFAITYPDNSKGAGD